MDSKDNMEMLVDYNKTINNTINKAAKEMKAKIYHYFNVWGVVDFDEVLSSFDTTKINGMGNAEYGVNVTLRVDVYKIREHKK